MTERELKKFALVGILVRIKADKEKLERVKQTEEKERIKHNVEYLTTEYYNLLNDLQEKLL